MHEDLTKSEYRVLQYIKDYIDDKFYAPSIKEIATNLNIKSTSTVHRLLGELDDKGYIQREQSKNRAIKIVSDKYDNINDNQTTLVPLLGIIQAGMPIMAEEHVDDYIPLPNEWLGVGEYFMLRVRGDSMIDAGIFDGDYLIVQKTNITRNGEIVVALVDGEQTTVKRFYKEPNGKIRLQPENPMYEAIYSDNIEILGKVKKSVRNYF